MTLYWEIKAMKLGMMVACAALATLAFDVNEADAGQKGKKQQFTHHGNVHIGSRVSSKNLKALQRQLKGHQKDAVSNELNRREKSFRTRHLDSTATWAGEQLIIQSADPIMGLMQGGLLLPSRKRGH
jgi:hypothetical protein